MAALPSICVQAPRESPSINESYDSHGFEYEQEVVFDPCIDASLDQNEEDAPMSDMPDVSSDIDQQATHPKASYAGSRITRKFISRVDGAGLDAATSFNMLPAHHRSNQRLLTKACRSVQHKPSTQSVPQGSISNEHQTEAGREDRSPQPVVEVTRDTQLKIDSTNGSESTSSLSNSEHVEGPNESTLGNGQQQVTSAILEQRQDKSSQNESNASTVLGNSEDDVQMVVDDSDATHTSLGIRSEANGISIDQHHVPAETVTLTHVHSGGANPQHKTTPDRHRRAEAHVPILTNDSHRVSKHKSNSGRADIGSVAVKSASCGSAVFDKTPSEEDLLYLLMYHARQREQISLQRETRRKGLEEQNTELLKAQTTLQQELEGMAIQRDDLVADAEESRNELDLFKHKYKKLKAWALEMNSEYAAIRQHGSDLKASMISLQQETSNVWRPVQATLTSNHEAIKKVDDVKNSLTEAKKSVSDLKVDLQHAHTTIAEKCAELRMLKVVEAEHKSHVRNLLILQKRTNDHSALCQERLTKVLDALSKKIDSLADGQPRREDLAECLGLLKNLSERDIASGNDLTQIESTVVTLTEKLVSFQKHLEDEITAAKNPNEIEVLLKDILSIKDNIQALRPARVNLEQLQQDNARLQEKSNGDAAIRRIIEEARCSAETRRAEVQKNNDKLIESIARNKENIEEQKRRVASDAETQLSAVTMRWTAAAKELEEAKIRARDYQNEASNLRQRLAESEKHLASEVQNIRAHHDATIQKLNSENDASRHALKADYENQVQMKNEGLATMQEALQNAERETKASEQKAGYLSDNNREAEDRVKSLRNDFSTSQKALEEQKQLYRRLSHEFSAVQKATNTLPALKQAIQERDAMIEQLQAKATNFVAVKHELAKMSEKHSESKQTVEKLREKLDEANILVRSRRELEQQISYQQKELESLAAELDIAKEQSISLNELKQELQQRDVDMIGIQNVLEDTKSTCKTLQNAVVEKEILEMQVRELKEKMSTIAQHVERISQLETSVRQRDDTILDMEKQLLQISQLTDDLDTVKCRLQQTNDLVEVKNKEIEGLRTRNAHTSSTQPCTQIPENDLDGIFTQNTDLSIPTCSHAIASSKDDDTHPTPANHSFTTQSSHRDTGHHLIIHATPLIKSIDTGEAGTKSLSQPSFIPDSQLNIIAESGDCGSHDGNMTLRVDADPSSPLSDINEDWLVTDVEVDESDSEHEGRHLHRTAGLDRGHDATTLPTSSPHYPSRHRVAKSTLQRRSSIISLEEMLLQASETGRQSTPGSSTAHHAHPVTKATGSYSPSPSPGGGGDQSRDDGISPRRLRSDLQIRVSAHNGHPTSINPHNVATTAREKNLPNSAIKRRADESLTEANGRFHNKRLKMSSTRANAGPFSQSNKQSPSVAALRTLESFPVRSRNPSADTDSTSTVKKKVKSSKAGRKHSKQDRYAVRFNSSGQE